MNIFTKALNAMRHSGRSSMLLGFLRRTKFDYAKEVGTGIDSSVVTAPIQWVQRAFTEARLRVVIKKDGDVEEDQNNDLVSLILNPNPAYSGMHLWSATIFSYLTAGNAYWLKIRSAGGKVVELWYVPHWLIEAKWPDDGSQFISHYQYRTNNKTIRLEPEDVVHFRHGIDPRNARLGLSPLHGVIREIFMDLEASNFVASLLRNGGVPGVVISPDGDTVVSADDAKAVKAWFKESFGGDRRGAPLVMAGKTKVQQYGFTPAQMDLSVVRNVAEERVCASLGIPAAVVGFGTGMQQTKVGATMNELRRLAWINGIIPIHRYFAIELRRSLLPDLVRSVSDFMVVEFDVSEVMALEDDLNLRAERFNVGIRGGWIRVSEGRRAMGLDVDPSDEIFLRGLATLEVRAGAERPPALSLVNQEGKVVKLRAWPKPAHVLDAILEEVKESTAMRLAITHDMHQKSEHTLAEIRATENPRLTPTEGQIRYVAILAKQQPGLASILEKKLAAVFDDLGDKVATAALPILEESFKASAEDMIIVGRIFEAADIAASEAVLTQIYEAHYLTTAKEGGAAAEILGLATDLADPVARAVVSAGGKRAGLLDLAGKAKTSLFTSLTEGRALGEGADALARRIRGDIPKGPWSDAKIRSRVVARTETAFAQNISTIERSRDAGFQKALIHDNLTGHDDDVCSALNGVEVTLAEAEALAADEHPNGTRNFSPIISL